MTRKYAVAIALLLAGGVATEAASRFIVARFPARPLLGDLVLDALPHLPWVRYATTALLAFGFVLFAWYALRSARPEIPAFLAMLGIMYLLRAGLMVLTPFANANDGEPAAFPLFQYGMFPSGHTAAMLLLARFTDATRAPRLRLILYVTTALVALGLLLTRSHYALDIAGGALLAYFVEREWASGRLFGPLKRLVVTAAE